MAQLEGHGLKRPIVKLYQHPTIRACAAFLEGDALATSPAEMAMARKAAAGGSRKGDVAIIGMSGRFPGAANVEELWKNLVAKKNSISSWTVDELDPSIPAELRNDPDYVKARGVIAEADKFDHAFFGVNPKVAALMDPQQRVFLETAWAALEDAAYDPAQFAGLIGVYAGMGNNTYFTRNVIGHPELIEQVGDFAVMTANEKDYIATRLAFEFDLRGPALSIHTACSTSLVAIVQAFKALRDGECDMALAGGIAITAPINSGIVYNEGGMYSPDGSTRTFDAQGKGTSFSDGCGIIVLKRLDSLFLTQVATSLSKKFGVKISFRQLNEELPNLDKLADHILPHWNGGGATAGVEQGRSTVAATPTVNALEDAPELKKVFGAQARIVKEKVDDMTPQQRAWFDAFSKRYIAKTAKSKAFTQENRKPMADPRVVTGFKPQTKELIYQVVVDKSNGCHLWDIDGNEYVDILSGFGSSMFGYMPDFIKDACHKQIDTSVEIGPLHPLAAEVSKLLCELTGAERAAVCNTGSEAVLGAMRMARTVTGRSLIISFSGSYHGINDEVIIRGSKSKKSYPGAPGIMPEAVQNMMVLDYGTPESLEIIKQRCHEAAAVLVEPVQSRRMEFRPVDFLREVRRITQENGTALIFDEVITGFRTHPNVTQALFGIQADIGTYGKVIGGGMPVGAMIGKSEWMDALDGGHWQYGDDSVPPAGVTYFAGTFVRHPLTLAAMKAALVYMKNEGPALQERLNTTT
ncbi:MAG: aminotransferase class III-fold pyridoxal phosphate-dependent enzyme, partial [Flavobacteriales bacterium]